MQAVYPAAAAANRRSSSQRSAALAPVGERFRRAAAPAPLESAPVESGAQAGGNGGSSSCCSSRTTTATRCWCRTSSPKRSRAASLLRLRTLGEALADPPELLDCVLLDLGLPDTAGVQTVARLRARLGGAPLVVLTGLADESAGIAAVQAGAQDYLVKGRLEPGQLGRSIRYAVGRRATEEAERELLLAEAQAREVERLERGLAPSPLIARPGGLVGLVQPPRPAARAARRRLLRPRRSRRRPAARPDRRRLRARRRRSGDRRRAAGDLARAEAGRRQRRRS